MTTVEIRGIQMKRIMVFLIALIFVLGLSMMSFANSIYISTQNDATLGANELDFQESDVVSYRTQVAAPFFDGSALFSGSENIDAFHMLDNGNLILSTTLGATLGGLTFKDGDLIIYDIESESASYYLKEDDIFSLSEDIDAASILPNGHILLSTDNAAKIGSNRLKMDEGDLVEYNPFNNTASIFFSVDWFASAENIDAVSVLDEYNILLSTATAASLGGLDFDEDDLVQFNLETKVATLVFDGNMESAFTRQENINAVFMNFNTPPPQPNPVPEPATMLLLGTGLVGLAGVRQRKLKMKK